MEFKKISTLCFVVFSLYCSIFFWGSIPCVASDSREYSVTDWLEAVQSEDRFTRMNVAYAPIDLGANPQKSTKKLIAALKHPNADVRKYVVNVLAELPIKPEITVPVLSEALRDKNEHVRNHAVVALAKLGAPAVSVLVEALTQQSVSVDSSKRIGKDGQTDVRLSDLATIALWNSEAPVVDELFKLFRNEKSIFRLEENIVLITSKLGAVAVPELLSFLKEEDTKIRSLAINCIYSIGADAESAIPELLAIAQESNTSLSKQAVSALARIGPHAGPALVDLLLNHSDAEIRKAAVYKLQWIREYNAVSPLVKALQDDPSPDVRASAARAFAERMGRITPDYTSAVIALAEALKDTESSVQENAAYALRVIVQHTDTTAKAIVSNLIEALQVPNGKIQSEVASVLGSIGKDAEAAVPVLIGGLSNPPQFKIGEGGFSNPQNAFISALGKITDSDSKAVSVLREILQDQSRNFLHSSAVTALGKMGADSQSAVPLLVNKYRNEQNEYERRDTAKALAMIQPDGTLALLKIIQNSGEEKALRLSGCNVLEGSVHQNNRVVELLRQLLKDPDLDIRLCAAQKLAEISDSTKTVLSVLEEAFLNGKQWEAIEGFEKIGAQSISTFLRLLEKDTSENRERLIESLGKIYLTDQKDKRVVPALTRLLQNSNPEIRESAAEVLETLISIKDSSALIQPLISLLKREIKPNANFSQWRQKGPGWFASYPVPASAAFSALKKFGPSAQETMPEMIAWLDYPDVNT